MKRKIEILLLVAVLIVAGFALILSVRSSSREGTISSDTYSNHPLERKKETTIRNVTDLTIQYGIKSIDSTSAPEEKILEVGEIDRIKSVQPLEITFMRAGREAVYELAAGTPYSFRYDEDDLLQIYEGSHGRADAVDLAPYVPTPMNVVEKMLEIAEVDKDDIIYDIGCGDGRIVITAAKLFGARGVGIDIDLQRIKESKAGAKQAGVEDLVEFYQKDATKMDISSATVVTMYLLPESNALMIPQLEKLKPGSLVVTHNYHIPGWEDKELESIDVQDITGSDHSIFLYKR